MKYTFKYWRSLDQPRNDLEIEFDQKDHDDYINSYIEIGSQLLPEDKIYVWNRYKALIVHDIISTYPKHPWIYQSGRAKADMFIDLVDRGEKTCFATIPNCHFKDFKKCRENNCTVFDAVAHCRWTLCEICGVFFNGYFKATHDDCKYYL